MNILLTSIGRRVELVSHLKNTFRVIGVDSSDRNAARHFVDLFYRIPHCDEPEYLDELLRICLENNVRMIIPLFEGEFETLCLHRYLFEKHGIVLLLSDIEVVRVCNHKDQTQEFFEKEEIKCPKVVMYAPAVIKPVCGMGSRNVFCVNTNEELSAVKILMHDDYIIQEKITGAEYTIDVLCDLNGRVISVVPRLRVEVRAGEVSKSVTEQNDDIIEKTIDVVNKLNKYGKTVGPLTVQCFLTADREVIFLEINPRFGGGVPLTFRAGIDYGRLLKCCLDGNKVEPEINNFNRVEMFRYDQSVYVESGRED